jgi:CBS domain-containing protein
MKSESLIYLVTDGQELNSTLYHLIEHRYSEGHQVHTLHVNDALDALEDQKQQGRHVSILIYDQAEEGMRSFDFLKASALLYPETRRILLATLANADAGISSLNQNSIQHMLVKPSEPIETKLFPIIDELLADWNTTVQQPFVLARGVMTVRATRIHENATLHRAAEIVALSGIGDLMVVDDDRRFVGVLSVGDILRAAMPDMDEILKEGGSLSQAFQLFLRKASELTYKPIKPLIIREPITVDPDDHVAKIATILLEKNIGRLPVVKDGRLVGTVSRADICEAVIGVL